MFRRRGLMRQIRRELRTVVPPLLQHANRSMERGDYGSASEAFEKLARGELGRRRSRAPMFFLQAGRARLLNNDNTRAVDLLKEGLLMLANAGQWFRLHQLGRYAIQELNQHGLTSEATEIENILKSKLPADLSSDPSFPKVTKKAVLPTHCPSCGAVVRPDEVEWLDDVTAECAYCGSPIRSE